VFRWTGTVIPFSFKTDTLFEMLHGTWHPEVLFLSLRNLKVQKIKLFQICIIFENVEYLEIDINQQSSGYAEFKWHLKH